MQNKDYRLEKSTQIYRKVIANRCYGVGIRKNQKSILLTGSLFCTPKATALLFINFYF